MKIAGHTLGTPGMTLEEALNLFHSVGIQAAEIIWQDGYSAALPEANSDNIIRQVRKIANDLGMEIAALTPYLSGFNSLDDVERKQNIESLSRCIDAAAELDCHHIRVYAGSFMKTDQLREEKWWRLIESLQIAGERAACKDVILCVENHFNTMTVSAAETVALVKQVNSPGVGILYDQANLTFTHNEPYQEAIPLQHGWIRYVHAKDLIFIDPDRPFAADSVATVALDQRAVRSRVVGQGILDWRGILTLLKENGYDGYLSLEYEYRWHPQDLPEPSEGFRLGADSLRQMLAEMDRET